MTLLSYRLVRLRWAMNSSDHDDRKACRATRNDPLPEIDVPRPSTRRCMGLLELQRTRRHFAGSRYEHGRLVHRDPSATGRRRPNQAAFSCARGTDSSRRGCAACEIRSWIGIAVHRAERTRPAKTGGIAGETSQDATFVRKIVIQSSGVMNSTASFERRTGTNSNSTRSRQWSAHFSSKRTSSHSINWKQRSKFVSTQLST